MDLIEWLLEVVLDMPQYLFIDIVGETVLWWVMQEIKLINVFYLLRDKLSSRWLLNWKRIMLVCSCKIAIKIL